MQSNLSLVSQIQKDLYSLHYPDAHRISYEIENFLTENNNITYESLLNRLKKNEPWEYIQGWTEFCGNRFKVYPAVLIPRIETEQLVIDVAQYAFNSNVNNILDIGTGSGCISISIKKQFEEKYSGYKCNIYATDISEDALNIAKQNESTLLSSPFIQWMQTDLLESLPPLKGKTTIVANLPYIPTNQYMNLDSSVKDFEPRLALDGGKDGLDLYRKLIKQIKEKELKIDSIFLETEESIFTETSNLLRNSFQNISVEEKCDLYERDRFVYAYFK